MVRSGTGPGGRAALAVVALVALLALVAASLPLLALHASPASAATGDVTLVAQQLGPVGLTAGGDGNLWFVDTVSESLVKLTTAGAMTFAKPTNLGHPRDLAWGPDGRVWFTDPGAEKIGAFDPATNAVSIYTPTGIGSTFGFSDIVSAAGDLWFLTPSLIVRMHPDGTTAGYHNPTHVLPQGNRGGRPRSLVAGPDGNLWFTFDGARLNAELYSTAAIGRLTPAGVQTEFLTPPMWFAPEDVAVAATGDVWTSGPMYHLAPGDDVATRLGPDYATTIDGWSVVSAPDGNTWIAGADPDEITRVAPDESVLSPLPIPTQSPLDMPRELTVGPDGNVWYLHGTRVMRITTAGVVTPFAPHELYRPTAMAPGLDGDVWVVSRAHGYGRTVPNSISRVTAAGDVTTYVDPALVSIEGVTVGADGNVWFTDSANVAIGRLTPAGVVTTWYAEYVPTAITSGPDGNVWYAAAGHIGRVTPAGVITTFTTNDPGSFWPSSIVAGPDGNLWAPVGYQIAKVTPAGNITRYDTPDLARPPIAVGPDGRLWFPYGEGTLGAMTTAGVVETVSNAAFGTVRALRTGPDGALWLLSSTGSPIVRYVPGGAATTFPGPPVVADSALLVGPDDQLWFTNDTSIQRIEPGPPPVSAATVTITPSANPSMRRDMVTLHVDVALEPEGAGLANGQVTIKDGDTTLATTTVTDGHASYSTWWLTVGTHHLTATFDPPDIDPVTSAVVDQVVQAPPHSSDHCGPGGTASFADVPTDHPFCVEIGWVVDHSIASGYSPTAFRPSTTVSRQAMASFLWKAAGAPPNDLAEPFFADVPPAHPFYAAIQWMADAGLSTGSTDPGGGKPRYKPTDGMSRQAAASFLWRSAWSPAPTGTSPHFADVGPAQPFYAAIQWANEAGLANGTPAPPGLPTFGPTAPVSRQAMAAFLSRFDQLPVAWGP